MAISDAGVPGGEQLLDARGDLGGLRLVVLGLDEVRLRPGVALGNQLQRRRPGDVAVRHARLGAARGEHPVGQVHHLRGGAVVAHQLDHRGVLVLRGEVQQVARGGAGEGVDGLRGVAHHAEFVAPAQPQVEQALLERGNVLVLVDHEVAVLVAHRGGNPLVVLQDGDGQQQHVLEVDVLPVGLHVLVGLEDARDGGGVQPAGLPAVRRCGDVALRGEHRDLRPFDLRGEVADRGAVGVGAQAPGGLGDQRGLVVDDAGQRTADGLRPEVLQLAQRRGVEGARLHRAGAELAQAGAHFCGGAGGEGDGQQRAGLVDARVHPVGDAVGDGPGLAGAGAGEHAQRPVQRGCHLALLGVQPGEDAVFEG